MAQETVGTVSRWKNRKKVGLIKTLLAAVADPRASGNATDDMSHIHPAHERTQIFSAFNDAVNIHLQWKPWLELSWTNRKGFSRGRGRVALCCT